MTPSETSEETVYFGELTLSSDNRCMLGWRRRPVNEDFPKGFRIERTRVVAAMAVAKLPPADIAEYFRKHPETANDLLNESYDKRYSPASFIGEENYGFSVGWYSRRLGFRCVRRFSNLADAATDYLLFSLGKGRWTSSEDRIPTETSAK